MRAEVARVSPADVRGYEKFHAPQRGDLPHRLRKTGSCAVRRPVATWRAIAPDLVRLRGDRSVYDTVARLCPPSLSALRAEFSSAVRRRKSLHHHLDLLPDFLSGAPLGRAFRHGRHRQRWCAGWSVLFKGRAMPCAATAKCRRLPWRRAGRPACASPSGETLAVGYRGFKRRCGLDLQKLLAKTVPRKRWTDSKDRQGAPFHEPVCLVFRHAPGNIPTSRTTPFCWGRAIAN